MERFVLLMMRRNGRRWHWTIGTGRIPAGYKFGW